MKRTSRPFTEIETKRYIEQLRAIANGLPGKFWKRKRELLADAEMYERGNIGLSLVTHIFEP